MPIRLQVLGGLQAFLDDVQLTWVPSHRIRSELLVYLALEREVPRERLAGVFWPDQESDRAQHGLSQALYRLRQTFGDDFIVQNGAGLRFGVPVACDALDFEQLVERGDLAGAMAIYRGAFLKDVAVGGGRELDAWVDQQRAKYARLHRRACRGWIDGLVREGKLSEAIEAARGWTALEPFDDEAQHRLIELLAASGQRSEALVQYDQYERLLKAEGLTPLDETMALVAKLRAGGRGNGGAMAPTSGASAAPYPAAALREEATMPPPGVSTPPGTASLHGPGAGALKSRRARVAAGAGAILVMLGVTGVWALRSRLPPPPPAGVREPVVVLPFEARGSDPELDELGVQAAEGVAAAIEREKLGKVVHYAGAGGSRPFTRRLGRRVVADTRAGTVVTGVIVQSRDRVEIQARVLRGHDLATVWTLGPERGSGTDPTGALDAIRERVLGAVGWYVGPAGEAKNASIIQPPPGLEVLRLATKASESLSKANFEEAIEYYRRAYARDTTYLHPLRMLYPAFMNIGKWREGDSVLALLEARRSRLYRLDALVLDKFVGQRGSPEAEVEAALAVFNADSGAYGYVRSLLAARRATEALRYYQLRDTTKAGDGNRRSWDAAAGSAYHMLGRFEEQLAIARAARAIEPRYPGHWFSEVSALGALGRTREIDGLITASSALEASRMPARLLGLAADELSGHGFDAEARAYAERALVALKAWPVPHSLADSAKHFSVWIPALYVLGRYEEVVRMNEENSRRLGEAGLAWRVMAAYHRIPMGDTTGALALVDSARTQPSSAFAAVGWGGTRQPQLMWAAGILSLLGRKDEAVATLREAMNNGLRVEGDAPLSFCWAPLRDHPGFKELTRVR